MDSLKKCGSSVGLANQRRRGGPGRRDVGRVWESESERDIKVCEQRRRVRAEKPHLQESWTIHRPMETGWTIVLFFLIYFPLKTHWGWTLMSYKLSAGFLADLIGHKYYVLGLNHNLSVASQSSRMLSRCVWKDWLLFCGKPNCKLFCYWLQLSAIFPPIMTRPRRILSSNAYTRAMKSCKIRWMPSVRKLPVSAFCCVCLI